MDSYRPSLLIFSFYRKCTTSMTKIDGSTLVGHCTTRNKHGRASFVKNGLRATSISASNPDATISVNTFLVAKLFITHIYQPLNLKFATPTLPSSRSKCIASGDSNCKNYNGDTPQIKKVESNSSKGQRKNLAVV